MTFPRGHRSDLMGLLLAHLGDEGLTGLPALVSDCVTASGTRAATS